MIRKLILAAAISSSLLSGGIVLAAPQPAPPAPPAHAAPPPPPPHGGRGPMLADTNHDGVITRAEAMADADRMFAKRDINHDGRLTGAEVGPPRGARADGPPPPPRGPEAQGRQITKAKFEKRMMRRFDKLDANRDGQIARAEIKAFRQQRRDQRMQNPNAAPRSGADDRG